MIPTALPHRGSPVVTIMNGKSRTVLHHEPSGFWSSGGESMESMEVLEPAYQDLDVRTCKMGRTRHYGRSAGAFGEAREASDVPFAERAMIGPVRFNAGGGLGSPSLTATNTVSGQTWTAAVSVGPILSVTAVPVARRVVMVTETRLLVYDVDANRVVACR